MNFATKDRFRLSLLIYRKVGHNSIFYYYQTASFWPIISKLLTN